VALPSRALAERGLARFSPAEVRRIPGWRLPNWDRILFAGDWVNRIIRHEFFADGLRHALIDCRVGLVINGDYILHSLEKSRGRLPVPGF
jgi:hypothetical protein